MVAVVIGLFLVAVMGSVYLGSKGTYLAQDAMARLQENGRFAVDTINGDLRMAGFRGCLGYGKSTTMLNTLATPTAALYDFGTAAQASSNSGGVWSPSLDPAISGLSPAPSVTANVLVVRRPIGVGWALTAEMGDPSAALTVSAPAPFAQGDLLMVTDCSGSAVFEATNADPATTGTIEHIAGTSIAPGMTTSSLGRPYLQDALVYRMETVAYYLAPSARPGKAGTMSLWAYANPAYDGTPQPAELVTGVEGMAVLLGVDTDGDQNADEYLTPDAVTNWGNVVSARVELLFASSQDNITTSPQTYTFGGQPHTPTDRKLRTAMTLVSSLRNSLP